MDLIVINETHSKPSDSGAGQSIVGRECTPILGTHVTCCPLQGEGVTCNQFVTEWIYHIESLASVSATDRWAVPWEKWLNQPDKRELLLLSPCMASIASTLPSLPSYLLHSWACFGRRPRINNGWHLLDNHPALWNTKICVFCVHSYLFSMWRNKITTNLAA